MTARPVLLVHTVDPAETPGPSRIATADGGLVASREIGARITAIGDGLARHPAIALAPAAPATPEEEAALDRLLGRLHAPAYLAALRAGDSEGRDRTAIGPVARRHAAPGTAPDTPLEAGAFGRARAAALAGLRAARTLIRGDARHVHALCRPPGHHAGRAFLGGYCFLNNAAVAALALQDAGHGPVHVLDLDYHVGNGTSDVLAAHPAIGFTSLHAATDRAFPYVPGLAPAHPAHRYVAFAAPPDAASYLAALEEAIATAHGDGVLVVSIGFDIIAGDPHGGWTLSPAVFAGIGARLSRSGRRLCLVQEGGYRIEALADCADGLAEGLLAACPV